MLHTHTVPDPVGNIAALHHQHPQFIHAVTALPVPQCHHHVQVIEENTEFVPFVNDAPPVPTVTVYACAVIASAELYTNQPQPHQPHLSFQPQPHHHNTSTFA